jgi:copper(I)-binding protein
MKTIFTLIFAIGLSACLPQSNTMDVTNIHMVATPKTFPAAAIFMDIKNNTDTNDRMVDFKTDRAGRVELHTMETANDIMKMRRVDGYDIASGASHSLKHMADHVMIFDMLSDFVAGETFNGTAIFENAGEVPVTITVKSRNHMMKHH